MERYEDRWVGVDFMKGIIAVVVYTEDDDQEITRIIRHERLRGMKKSSSRQPLGTDWERLSTMKDSKINLSDVPELDNAFFENATLLMPEPKKPISLRLDQDVVEWYRGQGSGYQTRMNAVLRMYMHAKTGTARRVPARRNARVQSSQPTTRR